MADDDLTCPVTLRHPDACDRGDRSCQWPECMGGNESAFSPENGGLRREAAAMGCPCIYCTHNAGHRCECQPCTWLRQQFGEDFHKSEGEAPMDGIEESKALDTTEQNPYRGGIQTTPEEIAEGHSLGAEFRQREPAIEQRPMPLAEQKKVYEAIKIVHEAEQAWWFAVNDGTSRGNPKERYIVLALLEAGWKPPC